MPTRDNDAGEALSSLIRTAMLTRVGCSKGQASFYSNANTRGSKNTSALTSKLLRRMRIVKPSVEPSYESKFHQACISESTPTSVMNSTDEDPPQTLFDFFGVPRDSEWGQVLRDRYQGLSTESPLQG